MCVCVYIYTYIHIYTYICTVSEDLSVRASLLGFFAWLVLCYSVCSFPPQAHRPWVASSRSVHYRRRPEWFVVYFAQPVNDKFAARPDKQTAHE